MGIRASLCVGGLMAILLAGCYEKAQVHEYQPGAYKGRTDFLVKLEQSSHQRKLLRQRLNLVQTDR